MTQFHSGTVVSDKAGLFLTVYDKTRDRVTALTESNTLPLVFEEGRLVLLAMLEGPFDVDDCAIFVRGIYNECQRRGRYPASLDSDICLATFCKNEDGQPGSTPDEPHFRELAQVTKNTGRKLFLAQLQHELGKVFIAGCLQLGIKDPQNLPFDKRLLDSKFPTWAELTEGAARGRLQRAS